MSGGPKPRVGRAVLVSAVVSGLPSTAWAVMTGRDPLEASEAAGAMLSPRAGRTGRLVASPFVHLGVTLLWTAVMARVLPMRRPTLEGAVAGVVIAGIDLGVVAHLGPQARFGPVRRLPPLPQLADHVTFGAVTGALLRPPSRASQAGA